MSILTALQAEQQTKPNTAWAHEALKCQDQAGFVFATPEYVLSSHNKLADIQVENNSNLSDWVAASKQALAVQKQQGQTQSMLMGGIPFASSADVNLMLLDQVSVHEKLMYQPYQPVQSLKLQAASYIPHGLDYQAQVQHLVEQMQAGYLSKAVLARILELEFDQKIDASLLLQQLTQANPEGYSYAVANDPQQQGWFMGASPELLVGKQGQKIWSKPVAGTLARDIDPVQDQKNAETLLKSSKDQHEHRVVIEMIADELAPFCSQLSIPKQPELIRTQRLWHLATRIQGELKSKETHVLDLVERLHPTPAICGKPTHIAKDLILGLEPFNRELFAGTMGWSDVDGNGEWSVTVRCARIQNNIARLFAGAGIVEASKPEAEHAETAAKLRTVLDGFALNPSDIDTVLEP